MPFQRRGAACPHCGQAFGAPVEGPATTGHLTVFGYGVCGLTIGAEVAVAAALADPDIRLDDLRLTLFPALAAVACAALAACIGRRLTHFARRGYEVLLFAGMFGALAAAAAALMGVQSAEALVWTGLGTAVPASAAVRRFAYPRR